MMPCTQDLLSLVLHSTELHLTEGDKQLASSTNIATAMHAP